MKKLLLSQPLALIVCAAWMLGTVRGHAESETYAEVNYQLVEIIFQGTEGQTGSLSTTLEDQTINLQGTIPASGDTPPETSEWAEARLIVNDSAEPESSYVKYQFDATKNLLYSGTASFATAACYTLVIKDSTGSLVGQGAGGVTGVTLNGSNFPYSVYLESNNRVLIEVDSCCGDTVAGVPQMGIVELEEAYAYVPGVTDLSWGIDPESGGIEIRPVKNAQSEIIGVRIIIEDAEEVDPGTYTVRASDGAGCVYEGELELIECGGPGTGGGGCESCDEFGQTRITNDNGPNIQFGMGSDSADRGAGSLMLRSHTTGSALYDPATLKAPYSRGNREVLRDKGGVIEQVKVAEGLIVITNVVTTAGSESYDLLYFYDQDVGTKQNGYYSYTLGLEFVTWTVKNPATGDLEIVEDRGGTPQSHVFTLSSGQWKLEVPDDLYVDWSWETGTDPLVKHREIKEGGTLVYKEKTTIDYDASGNVLSREIVVGDPSQNEDETTLYTYYGNTGDGNSFKLKQIDYPDGQWERYEYDSNERLSKKYEAWLDQTPTSTEADCKVTEYSYGAAGTSDDGSKPNLPRSEIVKIKGNQVSELLREVNGDTIEVQTSGDSDFNWDDSTTLTNQTTYYNTSDIQDGRVHKVLHQDATMSFYTYSLSNGELTTTVKRGDPNDGLSDIDEGTQTVTVTSAYGETKSVIVKNITGGAAGVELSSVTYGNPDNLNRFQLATYKDGTTEEFTYSCCGLQSFEDRDEALMTYYYDATDRRTASEVHGVTTTNLLSATGNTLVTTRIGTDDSEIITHQAAYNTAGRRIWETNALEGETQFQRSVTNNKLTETTTYPDSGTQIHDYYRDGRLEKKSGTAAADAEYSYGVEQDGSVWREFVLEVKLGGGGGTNEWTKTYLDGLGRSYKTLYPGTGNPYEEQTYNSKGQLVKSRDPDGVITLYQYNDEGELEYTAVDINQDSLINFTGNDRINRTIADIGSYGGKDTFRTRNYFINSSDTETWLSTTHASTDGLNTWLLRANEGGDHETTIVYGTGGARTETRTHRDDSQVVAEYSYGRLIYEIGKNSGGGQLWRKDYQYDAHGRRYRVIDARNGTTEYGFNDADQVTSVTTPPPKPGLPPQVTTTVYDNMGRVIENHHADGTVTYQEYYVTGLLKKTYGAKSYPVEYTYDEQGRMKTMKTWQDYSGSTGAATTEWFYDSARGWLVKKQYQGETDSTDDYEYHSSGRLWKRHWERGITTVYTYNTAGDLWKVDYSDTVPNPDLTYTYQRRGLLGTVLKDGITTTYTYNNAGLERTQSYSGGVLAGLSTERTYHANTSLDGLKLQHVRAKDGAAILVDGEYIYDSGGRLSQVEDDLATSPPYTADYTYLANSKLVATVAFKEGTTTRLTATRSYDNLNRLEQISSETSDSSLFPVSYSYRYNDANQRIRMTLADGSYWVYEYDALGQVKTAKRFWSSGELVAGQQLEYSHDDIGNRTETKVGGDTSGNNLRSTTYDADLLNQYDSRDNPGYVEVLGNAAVGTTVSINSSSSGITRRGEYFRKELSVANSTAQYESISVTTTSGGSESGSVFVPPATENYSHDTDGNLLSDGRWSYSWDQENRLVQMVKQVPSEDTSKYTDPDDGMEYAFEKLRFDYDHMGRRIAKKYYTNSGDSTPALTLIFLYDGWNLLAELNGSASNAKVRTYVWGSDLSGTLEGAGGVGGLVMVMDHTNGGRHHYPAYDGNGNVAGLADGTDGTWSARYEYGAFGEPLRGSGPMAEKNPFRFSTKYIDNESGLAYYGYRYYNPQTGRWLSRDPIDEPGFTVVHQRHGAGRRAYANPYVFVENNALLFIDPDGLESVFIRIETEIRPPDPEVGTKTWHYVEINEYGTILSQQTFLGITEVPFPIQGRGTLGAMISGNHPKFTVTFTGSAVSPYVNPGLFLLALGPGIVGSQLKIDYEVPVTIDFCSRTGTVGGSHDGYPSYMVFVNRNKVYDLKQTTTAVGPVNLGIRKLLPPTDISPNASFSW